MRGILPVGFWDGDDWDFDRCGAYTLAVALILSGR
jgi:hypothetical protein